MNIEGKVAVVTGAGSGIGEGVAQELAKRGAKAVIMVDLQDHVFEVAKSINESVGNNVDIAKVGDATDEGFRKKVYDDAIAEHGVVAICVPAAGITRDSLTVKIDKSTGKAEVYPIENFRKVTEVNLIAPIYWAVEMVARIAEDRYQRGLKRWEPEEEIQGTAIFIGSVSSQGNKGQISYAVAKAGLEGAESTLTKSLPWSPPPTQPRSERRCDRRPDLTECVVSVRTPRVLFVQVPRRRQSRTASASGPTQRRPTRPTNWDDTQLATSC